MLISEELAERLSVSPGSKDRFGTTAAEVLETAALVATADQEWDKESIADFQNQQKIHAKVWSKLVAIHKDQRLREHRDQLPASYTALYAIVVMSDEEFNAAVANDLLKAVNLSSRAILDWTKAYRLRGKGIEQEVPLTLVLRENLTEQQHQELLEELQSLAGRFGAEILEGKGGVKQAGLKADARKTRAQVIEDDLMMEIGSVIADAPVDLKKRFGIIGVEDLIAAPRTTFTGFFQTLVGKVDGVFWQQYGRAYCLKIARDFNLTDSRAERFQLKDRIKKAVAKWSPQINGFTEMTDSILETYMSK